jgi:hypothetical protein
MIVECLLSLPIELCLRVVLRSTLNGEARQID